MVLLGSSLSQDNPPGSLKNLTLKPSHTNELKIGSPVSTLPGALRSRVMLAMVGPVSVYSDWVRKKNWSTSSFSVWQHNWFLSVEARILPWADPSEHVAGTLNN